MKVELKEAGEALLQRRTSAPHQHFAILFRKYKNNQPQESALLRLQVFSSCILIFILEIIQVCTTVSIS